MSVTISGAVCLVALLCGTGNLNAADGQVWDARQDYLCCVDQNIDENLPWSYRAGETNNHVSYGDLLLWKDQGQWGFSPEGFGTYAGNLAVEDRPIFAGGATGSDLDELNEQVGGHGSYMIRWESPLEGWVQVRGYIYRGSPGANNGRVINWKILKDDAVVTHGFTPDDGNGPLFGFDNRVGFETGNEGLRGTFIKVDFGTRIDLITPGSFLFDPGAIPDWVNTKYTIVEVDASDVPGDTIWDARQDFVNGLDQENDPQDIWSYRMGETRDRSEDLGIARNYGDVLIWRPQGQWGAGTDTGLYAFSGDADAEDRAILGGQAMGGGTDPSNEQIGGHGSYMVRWTSPVDSWVQISGYVYRGSAGSAPRRINWRLLHNDVLFTQGFTPVEADGTSPLVGFANRVPYSSGIRGMRGTFVEVSQGDTIDLITPGAVDFDNATPDWTNAKFTIAAVDAEDVLKGSDIWDARIDFVGELDQTIDPNLPWTYRETDGTLLEWSENALDSGPAYAGHNEEGQTTSPVVAGGARFGGEDPGQEQFGGHAPWLVRWTSPVTGTVQVDGYVYQMDPTDRLTEWQLIKNGALLTNGLTPDDGVVPLSQFGNRVTIDSGSGGAEATFINVVPGDNIDFVTLANNKFESTDPSAANAKLTITQVPGAPGNFNATPGDNAITLSWDAVPDFVTFTIDRYEIVQTSPLPGGVALSVDASLTSATVTGLQSGIEYIYKVRAVSSNGRTGPDSNEVFTVPGQDTRTEWDARSDWKEEDQNLSPNLPWSYRIGEPGNDFGNLLAFNADGQWGAVPAYVRSLDFEDRPVMAGYPLGSLVEDLEVEQIGGHGNFMLRWTSPMDGWVKVDGYIYQTEPSENRLMGWQLTLNGAVRTQGLTAHDNVAALPGFANRVFFEDGEGGLIRTYFRVGVGDHIDLLTPGKAQFGSTIPTFVGLKLSIKTVDEVEVPTASDWDARRDFVGALDQTLSPNLPWSYRSGRADTSGQLLEWRPTGQFGTPEPGYASFGEGPEVTPYLTAIAVHGEDPDGEQLGGHGPHMIRWTSPITGTVRIDGYIYQIFEAQRLVNFKFLLNDVVFWEGFIRHDEFGPQLGFPNRIFFEEGSAPGGEGGGAGLDGLTVDVFEGDNVDFITPGFDMFGQPHSTFVGFKLTYTPTTTKPKGSCCLPRGSCQTLNENACTAAGGTYGGDDSPCEDCPTAGTLFRRGDCDQSGKTDFNDAIFHLRFLFLGDNTETVESCPDACDTDDSGEDDFTDDINLLRFLFLGQGAIPTPGPLADETQPCGLDPTLEDPEELPCTTYTPTISCP